jgi:hypothetical protein
MITSRRRIRHSKATDLKNIGTLSLVEIQALVITTGKAIVLAPLLFCDMT